MTRFYSLLDNVQCMKNEHIQKEKEYGITWRSAFKKEMIRIATDIHEVVFDDDDEPMEADPFLEMLKIVR
jgi:hypothetical protein